MGTQCVCLVACRNTCAHTPVMLERRQEVGRKTQEPLFMSAWRPSGPRPLTLSADPAQRSVPERGHISPAHRSPRTPLPAGTASLLSVLRVGDEGLTLGWLFFSSPLLRAGYRIHAARPRETHRPCHAGGGLFRPPHKPKGTLRTP